MQPVDLRQLLSLVFSPTEIPLISPEIINKSKRLDEVTDVASYIDWCHSSTIGFKLAGPERKSDWENGWAGGGVYYSDDEYNNLPFYFKKNSHIRAAGKVFKDVDGFAEVDLLRALQSVVFLKHCPKQAEAIVEFGCGTGSNISFLKKILPGKNFYGADWAKSACEKLVENGIVSPSNVLRIDYFDEATFTAPQKPFFAFTNASLEQSGAAFQPFLKFLVSSQTCLGGVHIEPIRELLDLNCQLNQQSYKYARARGYLTGFVDFMLGQPISILEAKDYGIGSMFISGYQTFVWTKQR